MSEVEDSVVEAHMDELHHPDPAGCGLTGLLSAVNRHIQEEQSSILAYERLGSTFADPVIAAVMQLILDDEARHHAALQRIATSLSQALKWTSPAAPVVPPTGEAQAAVRELRGLADEEQRGAGALRRLARRGRDSSDDVCAVLLESMAMDSDKHARLLEFVIQRLAGRMPRPLPAVD